MFGLYLLPNMSGCSFGHQRVLRGLPSDSSYQSCGCCNDTVLHILRDNPQCVASIIPLFLRLTMRSFLSLLWSFGSLETSMPRELTITVHLHGRVSSHPFSGRFGSE
ncbi:hypothetical protein V6N12_069337 [Hibiscus sabdariffa]|uniref:Uncharacterized protein n=1 Tax=Hibiscus sabdariffa TaxID=183260 RepID=A0ABR2FDJ9_9ROSI